MNKVLDIIRIIIELIKTVLDNHSLEKPTDVSNKNIVTIRRGLDLAPKNDPEVANAKHRLKQIAKLPKNKRKARASEIREMQQLVKKKTDVPVPSNKENLLDQIRKAEGRQEYRRP